MSTTEPLERVTPEWSTGDYIRKARTTAGLTVEALADELGVNPETVRRWERGEKRANISRLRHVEDVCGISRGWLTATFR